MYNSRMAFELSSPAFGEQGIIPAKYTCDGNRELSPPLLISGVPDGTETLVLIMDDPDIPLFAKEARAIEAFDHWVLYNIPVDTKEIPEGTAPGVSGLNTTGNTGYVGPCPPPQYEPKEHRYMFVLYALSERLEFASPPTKQQVLDALKPITLATAKLKGRYSRA